MTAAKVAQRTPRPWAWGWRDDDEQAPGSVFSEQREGQAYAVAMCPRYGKQDWEANAAFIVRACNAWDDPVALRARLAELEGK